MMHNKRIVIIVEATDAKNASVIGKRLTSNKSVDEIRFLIQSDEPVLKSELLYIKHSSGDKIKISITKENARNHILRKCKDKDALYVFLGHKTIWISQDSIENLCDMHYSFNDHFITYMAKSAADRTGYLMHIMGMLPDALLQPWHANYIFTYKLDHPSIQQEAHEQILFLEQSGNMEKIDFHRYITHGGEDAHSEAFCFSGEDMEYACFFVKSKEVLDINDLLSKVSNVMLTDATRCNAICGGSWTAESDERTKTLEGRYFELMEDSHA